MAAYLPELIVEEEILVRLPVKSLVRFRCVCKSWLSLISTSRFICLHHKFSISNRNCNNHKIIYANGGYFKSLDYNLSPFADDSAVKTLTFPYKNLSMVGVCNGLVCLHNGSFKEMIIWNPSTGHYRELRPSVIPDRRGGNFVREDCRYNAGFGYDEYTDDYKVLVCYWRSSKSVDFRGVVVYSLKSNSWSVLQVDQIENFCKQPVIFLNGAFHWINGHMKIMAFKLADNTLKEIIIPKSVGHFVRGLGVLAGRLSCVLYHFFTNHYSIWSANEYGAEESSIKLPDNKRYNLRLNPLCSTIEGEIILFDWHGLVKFNPKTKIFFPKSIWTSYESEAVVFVESLFSPNGLSN